MPRCHHFSANQRGPRLAIEGVRVEMRVPVLSAPRILARVYMFNMPALSSHGRTLPTLWYDASPRVCGRVDGRRLEGAPWLVKPTGRESVKD